MGNFKDILQTYVNADYDTLVDIARGALENLLPACRKVDPDNDGFLMVSGIILSALGADNVLSELEIQFVCDVLTIDGDTFESFTKLYHEGLEDSVDKFADTLEGDVKANTRILILTVAACDESITVDESDFIKKILE